MIGTNVKKGGREEREPIPDVGVKCETTLDAHWQTEKEEDYYCRED